MSQTAIFAPPVVSLPTKAVDVRSARPATSRLFRHQDESICGLCWLVAIAGSFLLIGIVGMLRFQDFEPITFSGRAGLGAVDNDATDVSMAELLAEVEESQVNPTEEVVDEVLEVPETPEVPIEALELPELAEALVTEDLFTVPAAPKVETVLKPVDPVQPKPKPQAKPRPTVAKPASRRATSTATTAGGTEGSGGGGGGTGKAGAGAGKGRLPTPPFPSGARSRGVKGTLTFSLRISPAGKVEYAAVVSSNCINGGFTASEQSQLAAYICRNWFLPGRMGSLRLPVRFELR